MLLAAILFTILGAACVFAVLMGLPGTWALIALATGVELADGLWLTTAETSTFGGWLLLGAVALGLFGELLELVSGLLGSRTAGGSRRGMVGSFVGGLVGGLALTVLLPIPLIGTLVGVLVGTFAGAVVGEMTGPDARPGSEALIPALGATVARVMGTVAKAGVATVIWVTLSVAAFMV